MGSDSDDRAPSGPEAVVVRGGSTWDVAALLDSAEDARVTLGLWGVSVFADETGEGLVTLLETAGSRLPHSRIRVSTVTDLEMAGFRLVPSLGTPHYTLMLDDTVD